MQPQQGPTSDLPARRRIISTLVRLTISLLLITSLIYWFGGLGKLIDVVADVNLSYAALVLVAITIDRALMTYKWLFLLHHRGWHVPFFQAMRLYCAATLCGMLFPTTVGSDAIRTIGISRRGLPVHEALASIVIERVVGFVAALLLGLASLCLFFASGLLPSRFLLIWWIAVALLALAVLAVLASFSDSAFSLLHDRLLARFPARGIPTKLKRFHDTYRTYRENKHSLVIFFCLTMAEQLHPIVCLWLTSLALGIDAPLHFFAMTVPSCILISRLPIGIYGLGTFESGFAFVMHLLGRSGAEAVAVSFVARIMEVVALLPWGLAYALLPERSQTVSAASPAGQITVQLGGSEL